MTTRHPHRLVLALLLGAAPALAQEVTITPTTLPASTPATQPAASGLSAVVVLVAGHASVAMPGADGKAGEWRDAKVGDTLPPGTQIRTRTRSKLGLRFGDDTAVVIENATKASIDQFARAGDTQEVKLGLGYGAIRAGVAETTLRSDFAIQTPTATLSKRGTWDFRLEYEAVTGRFRASLAEEGLIEMFNQHNQQSMSVGPGQYLTQAMLQWFNTNAYDRWIPIIDWIGVDANEENFHALISTGITVVEPGGGYPTRTLSGASSDAFMGRLAALRAAQQGGSNRPPSMIGGGLRIINRGEGNFGTGSGN